MTIQEAAKEFNEAFKTEKEKNLENKLKELEEILITQSRVILNLANRIEYLESRCQ